MLSLRLYRRWCFSGKWQKIAQILNIEIEPQKENIILLDTLY